MLALSMIHHLDKDDALLILNKNLKDLKKLKEQWEINKQVSSESKGSNPLMLLSFESSLEILDIDIKTVEKAMELI